MAKPPGKRDPNAKRPAVASRNELNAFLDQLTTLKESSRHEEAINQREAVRTYLQRFDRQQLQRLIGRAFADALKSPSQKLGTAKPPSASPAAQGKRATKGKKRPTKLGRQPSRRGTAR
jgi:anti-sigma factor RsiW